MPRALIGDDIWIAPALDAAGVDRHPLFHPVELERLDDDMRQSEGRAASLFWFDARVGRLAHRLYGVPARRFTRGDDIAIFPGRLKGDHGVMARSFRLQ